MNRRARSLSSVLVLLFASLFAVPVRSQEPAGGAIDPAALQREIAALRLDPARAVTLKNVKLAAGSGTLFLDDGLLVPTTAVGGKTAEMVFLGKGRLALEAPDDIEAGQLELFTGAPRLDEEVTEIAMVMNMDAAVEALLRRPKATPDAAQMQKAEEIYQAWKKGPHRKFLDVETALLLDAIGDPLYQGYFAGWFRGKELGEIHYVVDPSEQEQVTLGQFVPLTATDREKRKILKSIARQQRSGRLLGVGLEDFGDWDTWVSASLRNREGKPFQGRSSFEPKKYTLDLTVAEGFDVSGHARIELEPIIRGARAVSLALYSDLRVSKVTDGSGRALFFSQASGDVTVLLPAPVAEGETVTLAVDYAGKLIDKSGGSFAIANTAYWYPHAGTIDRATYDATFHWPKKLGLLASGRKVDGGEQGDQRWEHRAMDLPVASFSFEIGRYRIETARAGHVLVTLAFDPDVKQMGKEVREEIAKSVTDSLSYFEELFGPYPLDELSVVTVPRDYSQASPGMVTLSSLMMVDLEAFNLFFGFEDRRTVIAHEVAHQWWGHAVGWKSYRDQWISEAMADYSAMLFARNRLDWKDRYGLKPTSGWQSDLLDELPDGRVIESVGPVVLGVRLVSSRAGDAYQPIVYKKGAVILDMLARSLGQDDFPKVLRQIVKVASYKDISTEDFLDLIGKITTADLSPFARQYIYGTGLPEVYYTYHFEPAGDGKWKVAGTARQNAPYRFRYRVVKTGHGLDVARERLDQIQVDSSILVVPVTVAVYDPGRDDGKKRNKDKANALAKTHVLLRGASTDFSFDLEQDPKDFWLDRDEEVFGRFFNESRNPKRVLYYQGLDAAAAGKNEEAEALFARALAAEVEVVTDPAAASDRSALKREGKLLDADIALQQARLWLDQGRDADARGAFDRAHKVLGPYGGWVEEELTAIESRLDIRQGDADRAFKRLRKRVLGRGSVEGTEGYVLLAIAAQATGHHEELEKALDTAKENGADVSLLSAGS
ncbi:MAG TPA: M1 family aminopeptidase [Thermoanaerobaculia bacterium]|nr:M1 family aminopeptidase [Thermoanaerobaculia bacterium]